MAQAEKAKVKPKVKKHLLSAVYVNRFGKHLSGAVIKFGAKEEKKQQQAAVCSPRGNTGPLTADSPLNVSLKSRRGNRTTFIPPPCVKSPELSLELTDAGTLMQNNENVDFYKFPLPGKSDAAKDKDKKKKNMNNSVNNVLMWGSTSEDYGHKLRQVLARVKERNFKLKKEKPSSLTIETSKPLVRNMSVFGKLKGDSASIFGGKREAFRVIYKMLHENENFRTRLQANCQKSTLVSGEQTISEREKDSPKTLDASPFGWV